MAEPIQVQIQARIEEFRWNEAGFRTLISKHGPLTSDLVRRAIRVEAAAKVNASQPPRGGVPNAGSEPGGGPAVRTGRLRGSITWWLGEDFLGVYADIGSAVSYAPYVELGTSRMEARPFLRPALAAAVL